MLVGAFEVHHGVVAAIALAVDLEVFAPFQHESVRAAGIEPDVERVVDLPPLVRAVLGLEEARGSAGRVPGVGALLLEGIRDALVHARVVEDFDRAVVVLAHKDGDRHAPGALAREHPVGLAQDHAVDAIFAGLRYPARRLDGIQRSLAQRVAWFGLAARVQDRLVHRDEPLRRIAVDHRLLRAPGMRVLVLEAIAREQHAGVSQRLDHGLVGVALLALVGEHALAGEARRLRGEARRSHRPCRGSWCRCRAPRALRRSPSRRRSRRGRGRARCGRSRCRCRR